MTTVNNRKVSLSPRKYGSSRAIRNVSPPSGKSEDPKQRGFFNRTMKGGKSIWDWLNFLATLLIPLVVVGATIWFGWSQAHLADLQHQNDIQIANDQQQEATLKAYLDDMTTLLLDKKLGSQAVADKAVSAEAAVIARAKTLTALRRLTDPQRKGTVVQFLYDSNLIGYLDSTSKSVNPIFHSSIIILTGTDLSGADLTGADLDGADLTGAHLDGAHLDGADLSDAHLVCYDIRINCTDLTGAYLTNASLVSANLYAAHLPGAHLYGADLADAYLLAADLSGADLRNADLSDAHLECYNHGIDCTNLTGAHLDGAGLSGAYLDGADLSGAHLDGADLSGTHLTGTIMPDGSRHS